MASSEIKTKVESSSLGNAIQISSADVVRCTVGDDVFKKHVPRDHMGQVILQSVVLGFDLSFYAVATETGLLCTVIMRMTPGIRSIFMQSVILTARA